MNPSDCFSDQLNSLHKTKHNFEPFISCIEIFFCFWKILKFFSTKYLHLGSCLVSFRYISILVPKLATRAMDSFSTFLPNIELTRNLLKLQQKWKFLDILISYRGHSIVTWVFVSILETYPMRCYSIFAENVLNESMALVAIFGTNIEMSLHQTKQLLSST